LLVSVVRCQVEVSETGRSLVQRSPPECAVSKASALHATLKQVQSPAENEQAMYIRRRNEKDGQSASRTLVRHSTSRR
jgi:hypothetical protein